MQIIRTEKLALTYEEREILDRTLSMMDDIINESVDMQLLEYANEVYDALGAMLEKHEM